MNQSDLNEVACQVLVKGGYANASISSDLVWFGDTLGNVAKKEPIQYHLCGTPDETLEGHRQMWAMVEVFRSIEGDTSDLWEESSWGFEPIPTELQWIVARVNWCLEQWSASTNGGE